MYSASLYEKDGYPWVTLIGVESANAAWATQEQPWERELSADAEAVTREHAFVTCPWRLLFFRIYSAIVSLSVTPMLLTLLPPFSVLVAHMYRVYSGIWCIFLFSSHNLQYVVKIGPLPPKLLGTQTGEHLFVTLNPLFAILFTSWCIRYFRNEG